MIEVGKVVLVARATVKPGNKRFTQYEYEMTLNSDSVVELLAEEGKYIVRGSSAASHSCCADSTVPEVKFDFRKLNTLDAASADDLVDIAGVIYDVGELTTVHSAKLSKDLKKRDVSLVDNTDVKISVTLWNNEAEAFAGDKGQVVVAKKLKVSDFGGKSLSTTSSGVFMLDPNMEIARELKSTYHPDVNYSLTDFL